MIHRKKKSIDRGGKKTHQEAWYQVIFNLVWLHRCTFVLFVNDSRQLIDDLIRDVVYMSSTFASRDGVDKTAL